MSRISPLQPARTWWRLARLPMGRSTCMKHLPHPPAPANNSNAQGHARRGHPTQCGSTWSSRVIECAENVPLRDMQVQFHDDAAADIALLNASRVHDHASPCTVTTGRAICQVVFQRKHVRFPLCVIPARIGLP